MELCRSVRRSTLTCANSVRLALWRNRRHAKRRVFRQTGTFRGNDMGKPARRSLHWCDHPRHGPRGPVRWILSGPPWFGASGSAHL